MQLPLTSNKLDSSEMFDTQELRAQVPGEIARSAPLQLPTAAPQPMHVLDRLNAVFKHRRLAGVAFLLVVTTMMVQTYSTIPGLPGLLARSRSRTSGRRRSAT